MGATEILITEPVEGVSPETLGERLAAVVESFDLKFHIEKGYVLTGWPDTGKFLGQDPQHDRLQSVEGIARACYVFRNDTVMNEAAAYFERTDGELQWVELVSSDWYGDAIEEIRETHGMDIVEEMIP